MDTTQTTKKTVRQLAEVRGIQPGSVQRWLKRNHTLALGVDEIVPTEIAEEFMRSRQAVDMAPAPVINDRLPTPPNIPAPTSDAPFYRRQAETKQSSQPGKLTAFQRWAPIVPLPLLGIPASYGVYHFALQFVPQWVAVVEAGAFEATYIGLAAANSLPKELRGQATRISWGAVWVSVIYNTIAGALSREPELFTRLTADGGTLGGVLFWLLALVHGAPLAVLAYLVSDLHIHKRQ